MKWTFLTAILGLAGLSGCGQYHRRPDGFGPQWRLDPPARGEAGPLEVQVGTVRYHRGMPPSVPPTLDVRLEITTASPIRLTSEQVVLTQGLPAGPARQTARRLFRDDEHVVPIGTPIPLEDQPKPIHAFDLVAGTQVVWARFEASPVVAIRPDTGHDLPIELRLEVDGIPLVIAAPTEQAPLWRPRRKFGWLVGTGLSGRWYDEGATQGDFVFDMRFPLGYDDWYVEPGLGLFGGMLMSEGDLVTTSAAGGARGNLLAGRKIHNIHLLGGWAVETICVRPPVYRRNDSCAGEVVQHGAALEVRMALTGAPHLPFEGSGGHGGLYLRVQRQLGTLSDGRIDEATQLGIGYMIGTFP